MSRVDFRIEHAGSLTKVPWHPQQQLALRAKTDHIVVLGGNQSGKTTVGAGIVARLVRRGGPIYERLIEPDHRPLKIWVCPNLHEKYLSHWEPRLMHDVFAGIKHQYTESPHPVFTWDDDHAKGNTVWGKSQEQGFLAFESDEVDLVVFDEEPKDRRLYTSALARLSGTNGVLVFTFTPLLGMSWTHASFYVPTVKDEHRVADRCWVRGTDITLIQMGMADNPHSVRGGGVRRMQNNADITEAERGTRLYGDYGYTEGLVLPEYTTLHLNRQDCPYIIPFLPTDRPFNWFFTCDPNKRHGGLLTAIDHEGNRYYCDEHFMVGQPDRIHAAGYKEILARWRLRLEEVGFHADPGGAGAQAIINLGDYGIYCQPVVKDAGSVSSSIKLLRRMAHIDPLHTHPLARDQRCQKTRFWGLVGAPRAYFLASLTSSWAEGGTTLTESRLMWEFRQYRQKEAAAYDTPVKENDDLVDCARYLELVRPWADTPPDRSVEEERKKLDVVSRMAAEDYDRVVARVMDNNDIEIEEL